jgi:hypothetical protein
MGIFWPRSKINYLVTFRFVQGYGHFGVCAFFEAYSEHVCNFNIVVHFYCTIKKDFWPQVQIRPRVVFLYLQGFYEIQHEIARSGTELKVSIIRTCSWFAGLCELLLAKQHTRSLFYGCSGSTKS